MALINPELVALARVKIDVTVTIDPDTGDPIFSCVASYDYSNGFDSVEVKGAAKGSPPIFVDNRTPLPTFVLFLSEPNETGTPPSQGGLVAVFNNVSLSTPSVPAPGLIETGFIAWQYGDYTLAGTGAPLSFPSTPYANVDPQKAIRFIAPIRGEEMSQFTLYVDVSVFKNPMTLYK